VPARLPAADALDAADGRADEEGRPVRAPEPRQREPRDHEPDRAPLGRPPRRVPEGRHAAQHQLHREALRRGRARRAGLGLAALDLLPPAPSEPVRRRAMIPTLPTRPLARFPRAGLALLLACAACGTLL